MVEAVRKERLSGMCRWSPGLYFGCGVSEDSMVIKGALDAVVVFYFCFY